MRSLSVGMESGARRIAVEIEHEARDGRMDQRRIEQPRELPRHAERAGIPGDVAFAFGGGQAQGRRKGREGIGRMLADQQDRRVPLADCRSGRPGSAVALSRLCPRMRVLHLIRPRQVNIELNVDTFLIVFLLL